MDPRERRPSAMTVIEQRVVKVEERRTNTHPSIIDRGVSGGRGCTAARLPGDRLALCRRQSSQHPT
jgi:hypothetical protein